MIPLNQLAHWTYTTQQWNEFVTIEKVNKKEDPNTLEIRNAGLLLSSDQNIMMLNFYGSEKFHEYYKSPGKSTFAKIALATLAVASTTIAMDAAGRAGANKNNLAQYNSSGAEMKRTSDAFAAIGSASFNKMSKRFKATENASFILTKIDGGVGLVKVDKDSGETLDEILIKDKNPMYEVDEVEGILYFKAQGNTINAYNLKK